MLPFLTAFDPLGGNSGSIDPLGALQTYGSLADLLLPGITTITTRSRYLSMVCAALANAETRSILPGASGLAQRRQAVEPFERLWALACVAARESGHEAAADGLRGITYAQKIYDSFRVRGRDVNCDFPLLKFQSRTGAVGTYWTALVGAQLVHADNGSLSEEGRELAEQFPELPLEAKARQRFADPEIAHRVSLSWDDLLAWSRKCHLKAAGGKERHQLGEALTADDRRDCVSRGIESMGQAIPDSWNTAALRRLHKSLLALSRAVALGLPVVIEAILVTEEFHESVLRVFETLLWWGTDNASKSVADLAADSDFKKSCDRCRETAHALCQFHEDCEPLEVCQAVDGLIGFARQVVQCRTEREVVTEILDRHHRVQSGKVDGGMPKRDWIMCDSTALLRPSPQFQLTERPAFATGVNMTHPYRLEPFVHMLQENGVLARG